MGKFGLGKKSDGDSESGRSGLFSRSKSKSPMPQANPYAQPPANPYAQTPDSVSAADPYNQAKANAGVGGYNKAPAYSGANSYPDPDSKTPGTASQYSGGYGARFGTQGGYGGGDRYGGQTQPEERGSRPGGYGGLGNTNASYSTTETNREAPFGAAKERSDRQQQSGGPPPYSGDPTEGGRPGGYGQGSGDHGGSSSYEAYGDRQLTAE